jgi:hypothetical protein
VYIARRRTILNNEGMLNWLGLQVSYCSLSSVMQLQWAGHVTRMKERNNTLAERILVEIPLRIW